MTTNLLNLEMKRSILTLASEAPFFLNADTWQDSFTVFFSIADAQSKWSKKSKINTLC